MVQLQSRRPIKEVIFIYKTEEAFMTNQKDRKVFEIDEKGKDFSKSAHAWLAQYDEEDDFLCGKTSNSLPEFTEEE